MTTAILAVQGAFAEHERVLRRLGESTVLLRQASDLQLPFDRLVLPGGESTVQAKLLAEQGMLLPLRQRIEGGMPTLATCAGLILLATDLEDDDPPTRLATFPMRVIRNAYGRQLGSFRAHATLQGVLPSDTAEAVKPDAERMVLANCAPERATANAAEAIHATREIPLTFIRAPRILRLGEGARTLVEYDGYPVAARFGTQIACAFHPELDDDTAIHQLFLGL